VTFSDILARLANVRGSGDQRTARCPAHDDHNNSLSVAQGDKGIVLKCFAGCSVEAICSAVGIEVKDLFPPREAKPARKRREPKPLTLADLAIAKKLPPEWLAQQGVADFPDGSGVAIGYFLEDGSQHARLRKRASLGKDGWSWTGPAGVPVVPYGLWRLREWR